MNEFIVGSMCLTTLTEMAKKGHSAFSKSTKDGKIYFNYAEWINDEPNQFGQHSSIQLNSSKEKKESEGKVYIGNGKKIETSKPVASSDIDDDFSNVPTATTQKQKSSSEPIDDLPF
jgi:hypothetical protein